MPVSNDQIEKMQKLLRSETYAVENAIRLLHNRKLFATKDAPLGAYYFQLLDKGMPLPSLHLEAARQIAMSYVNQLIEPDGLALQEIPSFAGDKGQKLLTMKRSGEFRIKTFGPNHCGIMEDLGMHYQLIAKCATILDDRGFLFDQINVDNFFQNVKTTSLSCELLCIDCAKKLKQMIQKESPECMLHSMDLDLSPEPYKASMTYTWKLGEA